MAGEIPHPRDTMDDVTEVSSTKDIEKKNTITITKNTEVTAKTFFSIIGGFAFGLILFFLFYQLIGMTAAAFLVVASAAAAPFLIVGRVNDPTQQARWRRILSKLGSKQIEGEVFFPNSDTPENITRIEMLVMKR